MEREKGVVMAPCFACGKALPTVEQPDGGRAAIPCDCSGEQAVAPPPPVDTPVREIGLVDDPEDSAQSPDEEEH